MMKFNKRGREWEACWRRHSSCRDHHSERPIHPDSSLITDSTAFWINRDKWDALNDGPYRMNQDVLPISFVKFHYRAKWDNASPTREGTMQLVGRVEGAIGGKAHSARSIGVRTMNRRL
jgi:hypothetical protein